MTSSLNNTERGLFRLGEILDSQTALANEMCPMLEQKQRALVEHNLADLHEIAEKELGIANRMQLLEEKRAAQCQEIARSLNGAALDVTLSELLEFLPASKQRAQVVTKSVQLAKAMDRLAQLNMDNGHLTQNLLDYTRMVMGLLTQGTDKHAYSAAGTVTDSGPQRALLDSRV